MSGQGRILHGCRPHLDHVAPCVHVLLIFRSHTRAVLAGVACQGLCHLVDGVWAGAVQECAVGEEPEVAEVCDQVAGLLPPPLCHALPDVGVA